MELSLGGSRIKGIFISLPLLICIFKALIGNISFYDCSHKIKRCLFLGRKPMPNLDAY